MVIVIIVLTSKGKLQNVSNNNVASYEFRRLDVNSLVWERNMASALLCVDRCGYGEEVKNQSP